ncbi:unnamed protein product [Boreogadus saida]
MSAGSRGGGSYPSPREPADIHRVDGTQRPDSPLHWAARGPPPSPAAPDRQHRETTRGGEGGRRLPQDDGAGRWNHRAPVSAAGPPPQPPPRGRASCVTVMNAALRDDPSRPPRQRRRREKVQRRIVRFELSASRSIASDGPRFTPIDRRSYGNGDRTEQEDPVLGLSTTRKQ